MPKSDVTVIIDIQRPTPKLGFGKPLILGSSVDGAAYKTYLDIDAVKVDYAEDKEEYKAAAALFGQGDNSPREIAIMQRKTADTIATAMSDAFLRDWYFLISTSAVIADVTAIADAVEANNTRQFFTRSSSKVDLATIKLKKYKRTTVMYHTGITNYPEAAWVGATGSADVGSVTWKFKKLVGITALDITATEENDIHLLAANTYVTKAGDDVTSEGKTVSGEWIDVIHSKDYLTFSIQYGIQKLLNQSPKVSYTDTGISQLEAVVKTVLHRADNQGMIAEDDDGIALYSTNFKSRAEVDPADRAARVYNDGQFSFDLAGAIHETTVRGFIRL